MMQTKIAVWVLILSLLVSSSCQDKNCQQGFVWNQIFSMCIPEIRRYDGVNIQHGKGYLFTASKQGQGSIAIGTPGQVVAAAGSSSTSEVNFNAADATALNTLTQMLGKAPEGTLKSLEDGKTINLQSNAAPEKKVETKTAPAMAYAKDNEAGQLDLGMVEQKPKEQIRGESKPLAAPPVQTPVVVKSIQAPPKNVQDPKIISNNIPEMKLVNPVPAPTVISKTATSYMSPPRATYTRPFDFSTIQNRLRQFDFYMPRPPSDTTRRALTSQTYRNF